MNTGMQALAARGLPFKNDAGQEIPAFAAMAVSGTVVENGITFLVCRQTNAEFVAHYAVNGPQAVAKDQRGTCFTSGEVRVLFAGGTPTTHAGWGPKPGQWELAQGYPGFRVLGIAHAAHQLARAAFEPVARLLIKTTAPVGALAATSDYRVYCGAPGSEADAGFATLPTARNRAGQSLAGGEWAWLAWVNDAWELHAEHNRIHPVSVISSVANGAAASVTLPDGRSVSATNVAGMTLTAGSATAYQDFTTGNWYMTGARASGGGGGAGVEITGFTIGANLSGGTAAATDDASAAITVTDPRSEFRRALAASGSITAAQGVAIKNAADAWIVLECQSKAGWCTVTLTADLGEVHSAAANLGRFGGTQQDVQRPVASTTITVYDDDALYKNALAGAKAIAIYDNPADKYRVLVSDQKCILAFGTLAQDMTATDGMVDCSLDYSLSPFPFRQQPVVTEAYNAWGSEGSDGQPVLLIWSEEDQIYYVLRPGGGGAETQLTYYAKLNGALNPGSSAATIDTVSKISGGAGPTITSANNPMGWVGADNDDCVIVVEGGVAFLQQVKLRSLSMQTDTVDAGTSLDRRYRTVSINTHQTSDSTSTIAPFGDCT